MQEGKSAGLSGAINGIADTYWGKNKGRSIEGKLEMATKILAVLFIVISLVLNLIPFPQSWMDAQIESSAVIIDSPVCCFVYRNLPCIVYGILGIIVTNENTLATECFFTL